jgi:hypothetical protein
VVEGLARDLGGEVFWDFDSRGVTAALSFPHLQFDCVVPTEPAGRAG